MLIFIHIKIVVNILLTYCYVFTHISLLCHVSQQIPCNNWQIVITLAIMVLLQMYAAI